MVNQQTQWTMFSAALWVNSWGFHPNVGRPPWTRPLSSPRRSSWVWWMWRRASDARFWHQRHAIFRPRKWKQWPYLIGGCFIQLVPLNTIYIYIYLIGWETKWKVGGCFGTRCFFQLGIIIPDFLISQRGWNHQPALQCKAPWSDFTFSWWTGWQFHVWVHASYKYSYKVGPHS